MSDEPFASQTSASHSGPPSARQYPKTQSNSARGSDLVASTVEELISGRLSFSCVCAPSENGLLSERWVIFECQANIF